MSEKVFKVVVVEQLTERVWYEVTGVETAEEALNVQQEGNGLEVYRKHLSTDHSEVEDVYEEEQDAV